jgi:hypothetical protein
VIFLKKSTIIICLVIISVISLGLKLYVTNFSTFPDEDAMGYILDAIGHTNGDFSPNSAKTLGWSLFLSPFFELVNSENFLDYSDTARTISIVISLFSIFMMYKLSRKFFTEKYSLVAACLFAFEPHLNYNSGQALSEPLYILIFMISFYFILNQNSKLFYLSFLFAGLLVWVRIPGAIMLLAISIIFFYYSKLSSKTFIKFIFGLSVFFLIITPILVNRYDTYGDPLYFDLGSSLFTGEFDTLQSIDTINLEYSAIDYIDDHSVPEFIHRFILTGIFNIVEQLTKISFPYLIILIPIGILFSFRAFDQRQKSINANWILILTTISLMIISFSVIPERRFLFYLLPFLIIFATIPIQRLIEYGLSTFSFTQKQKHYSLIIILGVIIVLSSLFMMRYDVMDKFEEQEQIKLAQLLENKISGNILDAGNALRGISFLELSEFNMKLNLIEQRFPSSPVPITEDIKIINISGASLDDFILNSEKENLKYIAINQDGVTEIWYPFLSDIYYNDQQYSYLKKIIDTNELGFIKFKVKVFEIDYDKFKNP